VKFWYLGSPYSKHPKGRFIAHAEACENAAMLIKAGVPIFCPIAHCHMIARLGGIDPEDHGIWLPADEPFIAMAHGIIVLKLAGWGESFGLGVEIEAFEETNRSVIYMEPGIIPVEFA
jgi:hypothetical protein